MQTRASNAPVEPLLKVENLAKYFPLNAGLIVRRQVGTIKALDGVSFELFPGETLGIVGESGCGKSTLGRTIMRLYEPTSGAVFLEGRELTRLGRKELVEARRLIQMVFQDPYASLDPRKTVGSIIAEPFMIHGGMSSSERRRRVRNLLALVELNPDFENRYPHEFSGGQRQRIGIARALALTPKVVVCDEPISSLDVSIQAQVINLLRDLQRRLGLTYIFISHDLSVVRHISHRVAVMYLGKIVEMAPRDELFDSPLHPYSRALLSSVCVPDPTVDLSQEEILEGDPPSPANPPSGCAFSTRCRFAHEKCFAETPALVDYGGRSAACHLLNEKQSWAGLAIKGPGVSPVSPKPGSAHGAELPCGRP